jgi:FHS family L-fucose permease-like MFS transporter
MMLTVSTLALLFVFCIMFLPKSVTVNVAGAALPVNMLFVALCGLCTSVMWGAIFNLSVEGLGKYTPMASGIFMTLVCGGGILPALQGWAADLTDYMTSYWVIVIGLVYLIYYALIGSKNVNSDIKVD